MAAARPTPAVPLVTVIVTFFNSAEYVDSAIAQIMAQSFVDIEVIATDDCSTDGTGARLLEVQRTSERPFRVLSRKHNEGVAAARNAAVAQARGEYVWFVDCDDLWSSDILESLVDGLGMDGVAGSSGVDVVVCQAVHALNVQDPFAVRLDGMARDEQHDRKAAIRFLIESRIRGYLWNKLIRTSLLRAHPFQLMTSQSDLAAVISILGDVNRIAFVSRGLYTHVVRPGSITNGANSKLVNSEQCWRSARRLAVDSGAVGADDFRLIFFDYFQYYASVIDLFYRSGSQSQADRDVVRSVRGRMKITEIVAIARLGHTRFAVNCALMMMPGPIYTRLRTLVRVLGTGRRRLARFRKASPASPRVGPIFTATTVPEDAEPVPQGPRLPYAAQIRGSVPDRVSR